MSHDKTCRSKAQGLSRDPHVQCSNHVMWGWVGWWEGVLTFFLSLKLLNGNIEESRLIYNLDIYLDMLLNKERKSSMKND